MRTFEEAKRALIQAIDAHAQEIIAIGDRIWKNPEEGYFEFKTSRLAEETLLKYGYSVKKGLAITGLRADFDSGRPGPCAALMGEMDSLIIPTHPECDPVTGAVHACGHNSHITAMLGAAIGFQSAGLREEISGKISFFACPAEEGGCSMTKRLEMIDQGKISSLAGKPSMILEGDFDDVDLALMNHIGKGYAASGGTGNIKKRVVFYGKGCHASAPEHGINALNALTHAVNALGLIRERLTSRMKIHGIVTEGGSSVNVVPDCTAMEYYIRGGTVEEMLKGNQLFDDAVHYSALAVGAKAGIRTIAGSLPVRNDPGLVKILGNAVRSAVPSYTGEVLDTPVSSSTDMGDITQIMPAVHGVVPGAGGTSHGRDFHIADKVQAYVDASKIEALMLLELMYGNAEKAREIFSHRAGLMSVEAYRKLILSVNRNEISGK